MAMDARRVWIDGKLFESITKARRSLKGSSSSQREVTAALRAGGEYRGHIITLAAPTLSEPVETPTPSPRGHVERIRYVGEPLIRGLETCGMGRVGA